MNSIYQTSRGNFIDLSRLISISPGGRNLIYLYFQLTQNPIMIEGEDAETAELFKELVEQWEKYKEEAKKQKHLSEISGFGYMGKISDAITAERARQNTFNIIPDDLKEHIYKLIEKASMAGLFSTSLDFDSYYNHVKLANKDEVNDASIDKYTTAISLRELLTGLGFNTILRQVPKDNDSHETLIEIYWDYMKRK
jgi:hypothetical protein